MKYEIIPVTPFVQNCTLIWCDSSSEAAVVDPGGDLDLIRRSVKKNGLQLKKIFITHAHLDHAGGAGELAAREELPIEGPQRADSFWIDGMSDQCRMFGVPQVQTFAPTRWLEHGDQVEIGSEKLEVRHCPGHTPGHVIFYHPEDHLAIVGDVLFNGSIGRTDFPQGDHATLLNSIRQQLLTLEDKVEIITGHGPMSTIGHERKTNPFLI